jgi:hypothetical protein
VLIGVDGVAWIGGVFSHDGSDVGAWSRCRLALQAKDKQRDKFLDIQVRLATYSLLTATCSHACWRGCECTLLDTNLVNTPTDGEITRRCATAGRSSLRCEQLRRQGEAVVGEMVAFVEPRRYATLNWRSIFGRDNRCACSRHLLCLSIESGVEWGDLVVFCRLVVRVVEFPACALCCFQIGSPRN